MELLLNLAISRLEKQPGGKGGQKEMSAGWKMDESERTMFLHNCYRAATLFY